MAPSIGHPPALLGACSTILDTEDRHYYEHELPIGRSSCGSRIHKCRKIGPS
jgi:hypothetical protein